MSHSVVASYTAHRTAIGTGGESGEWPDIAKKLARILEERVGELPLDPPLRNVWPFPVLRLNEDWPNLVVIHQRTVTTHADSCWREWRHDAHLALICGYWGNDPETMHALGTSYIDPIVRVLDANQTLDGYCKHIELDLNGQTWNVLSYGPIQPSPRQYYGLMTPLMIYGQSLRTWDR